MRALVSHPGLQHSHQVAWALEEADALLAFVSGVPVSSHRGIARALGLRHAPIRASKRLHLPLFAWGQRHIPRNLSAAWQHRLAHGIDATFDALVAALVFSLRPDVVVCFENAAERTFAAAQAVGAQRVLHAASLHHHAQRRWLRLPDSASLRDTEARKQRELDAADLVFTCSELAMQTFVDGDVPSSKLRALPLGTDLPEFPPKPIERGSDAPLRVVYLGTIRRLKGVDLLIDACTQLQERGYDVELTLIGASVEPDLVDRARRDMRIHVLGPMPQHKAFREVARHDVLALPSRLDSFGMVVPEAMALGLPCIISSRAGARCILEQHPDAGWLVDPEVEAVRTILEALSRDRGLIERASAAAQRAAKDYTWENYRARLRAAMLHPSASSGVSAAKSPCP